MVFSKRTCDANLQDKFPTTFDRSAFVLSEGENDCFRFLLKFSTSQSMTEVAGFSEEDVEELELLSRNCDFLLTKTGFDTFAISSSSAVERALNDDT